jgi:fatty-acyl-CoA synthase
MAAVELVAGRAFDGDAFARFLAAQRDLGTKWAPRFVRVIDHMPLTGTNKVLKTGIRAQAWVTDDDVWWRAGRGDTDYRLMTDADRDALAEEFAAHGRTNLWPNS